MKLLITGKEGQVGRQLTSYLAAIDCQWQVLALNKQELDITDKAQVVSVLADFLPDIVINTAAYTHVDQAEVDEKAAYTVNAEGVENLAKAAKQLDAVLIHLSSDYVFDGNLLNGSYSEDEQPNPCNVYGKTKLEGEKAIQSICSEFIILRTSWVFGEYGHNFVKTILRLAQTKENLDIVGDQQGGPTYALDIVRAIVKMVSTISASKRDKLWGIYHFSGYPYTTWAGFAQSIFEQAFGQKLIEQKPDIHAISSADYIALAMRPKNSCLNCQKIKVAFDIEPSDWQQAIKNDLFKFISIIE